MADVWFQEGSSLLQLVGLTLQLRGVVAGPLNQLSVCQGEALRLLRQLVSGAVHSGVVLCHVLLRSNRDETQLENELRYTPPKDLLLCRVCRWPHLHHGVHLSHRPVSLRDETSARLQGSVDS